MSSPSASTQKRSRNESVSPPRRSPPRQRKRPTNAASLGRRGEDRPRPPRSTTPTENSHAPTDEPDSPSRQRKRPTNSAAVSDSTREDARRRQVEREEQSRSQHRPGRNVSDFVTQHYNAVPERGREWRRTDSKIKGLRSYNNWVKSVLLHKCAPKTPGANVLDVGCGKGGDLMKWQNQRIDLYVGLDPAGVSIGQARERYKQMQRRNRNIFRAEFGVKDCFGESLDNVPSVTRVGFDKHLDQRWGGGGFDVVSMMFCMHYAFESEEKTRIMLKNVAGSLKKGGKFLGVIPNSDVLSAKVEEYHRKHSKSSTSNAAQQDDDDDDWDPEKSLDIKEDTPEPETTQEPLSWGNTIYEVKFPGSTPKDGVFRPPYGWKYFYFLEEAVEQVPEFVVPWEAFRGMAEDYNLELEYRATFREVWHESKDDPVLGQLSERMGVKDRNSGRLLVTEEEMDAASFYHAFCFYKV
jgi:mRNA (guanine-N7-)-methyltransferase